METWQLVLILAVVWVVSGVAVTIVMGRRGHDLFNWGVLGALFGPLVIPLAIDAARRERAGTISPKQIRPGSAGAGPIALLVGIDGSAESRASLGEALRLLDDRIGRLTLAAVIDYDAAMTSRPWGVEADAERTLLELEESVGVDAECVVLAGKPGQALVKFAREQSFDLLAIGSRGHGASKAVLGSVATHLVRSPDLPVLVARS